MKADAEKAAVIDAALDACNRAHTAAWDACDGRREDSTPSALPLIRSDCDLTMKLCRIIESVKSYGNARRAAVNHRHCFPATFG